jgi:hypothetical protein
MKPKSRTGLIRIALVIQGIVMSASNHAWSLQDSAEVNGERQGATAKIQIGQHFLLHESGMLPPGIPASTEDKIDLLASFALLFLHRGSLSLGLGFDIEANRFQVGPDRPASGPQVFGVFTFRPLALAEWRLRRGRPGIVAGTQPYAVAGAGWNVNHVGVKILYPVGSPPDGAPLDLLIDNTPAARVGIGVHQRVSARGLFLNLEAGWKWATGSYRMTFANRPDLSGDFDLSGPTVLFGLTLPLNEMRR